MISKKCKAHNLVKSKVNEYIFYCKNCGMLIMNAMQIIKPEEFNYIPEIDPLANISIIIRSVESNNNSYNKISPFNLNLRIEGIKIIKEISNKFELDEKIFHSSIYLLDELYLRKNTNIQIQLLSMSCIIIMTQFNGLYEKSKNLITYLFANNPNITDKLLYFKLEKSILVKMEYSLNFYTAYDILNILLYNGIIFEDEKNEKNLSLVYLSCIIQINKIIEKQFAIKFSPCQLAFSIVLLIRGAYGFNLREELFDNLYNYPFKEYEKCFNFLKSKTKIINMNSLPDIGYNEKHNNNKNILINIRQKNDNVDKDQKGLFGFKKLNNTNNENTNNNTIDYSWNSLFTNSNNSVLNGGNNSFITNIDENNSK